ncbi:MAG: hypothetical protein PWR17_713 [Candidatus Methanomethylophilaceae archaeon]|nr:hypothetical protein [Candidatus Methanomethylophilaceae archaeon]
MFGKKKTTENADDAFVKILGAGCRNCKVLEENTRAAMADLGMKQDVGHVTEVAEIAKYGVMLTPALVFGKEVVSAGKVLKRSEIAELIKKNKEMFQ